MSTSERIERRSSNATGSLRATTRKHEGVKIGGLAIPVGQWSEDLGGFVEQIQPGAFTASIETDDIRSLFNHDSNFVLGRKSAGTLRLTEDERGISYEVDAPNTTWAKDLAESIRRGDIRENSFGMFVTDDIWEERDGEMRRTVRVAQLREIGPQPFPAYPQSDVAVRSLEEVLRYGKRCVGAACQRGGQDPDVLLRELDSRPQLKPAPAPREWPSRSEYTRLRGNSVTGHACRATAFHEAGHAVHSLLDGCRIDGLSLLWKRERNNGTWKFRGGECVTHGGIDTSAMHLAGRVASELAGLGEGNPRSWSTTDDERAQECTKLGVLQDRQRARAKLTRNWPSVQALAARLLTEQHIDGDEATAIIMDALDERTRSRLRAAA